VLKKTALLSIPLVASLFVSCGPTLKGVVVLPNGTPTQNMKLAVYSQPPTDSVAVKPDGTFKISKRVAKGQTYTLIAEDRDGNMGFVRNYVVNPENTEKIIIHLSKEIDAKDAVLEGDVYIQQDTGPGEKIFKSSQ